MEYLISKTSAAYREDGSYEHLMIHMGLDHDGGNLHLSRGMIIDRDLVVEMISTHKIQFYTVEETLHGKMATAFPVFVENDYLLVTPNDWPEHDDLGELPVFSVGVYPED